MSFPNQVAFEPGAGGRPTGSGRSQERRVGHDRRRSDRRSNVFPFESRDNRLRFAAQAAGFGTYDWDCTTGDSIWSPELRTLAGLPPEGGPLSNDQAAALVHPEDRDAFVEKLLASLEPDGNGQFEDEHRLLRPDGTTCWVRTKGRTFFVGQGDSRRPLAATGVVMDVSASRAAADNLAESQDELNKMVEAAIDAIVTIDGDQRIIRFNPSAARMFGCPASEALGSRVERFMPERYRATHAEKVLAFAGSRAPNLTLDAPRRFVGLRADGQARMTTFMRDITDRVAADEALQRSKEDLELALHAANIGTWHWNLRNSQVELSDRCRRIFGIPADEALDFERIMAAIHPEDRETVRATVWQALEKGEKYKFEKRVVWPDDSIHWVECIGRDLHDEGSGEAVGMRGVTIDITERKRHEQALEYNRADLEHRVEERAAELLQANEALERSNMELQQFAFIAAHDLQTPLRSITGFAQLLRKDYQGRLDPQADVWLGVMVRSAQRMHELIRDVLLYSRVESRGSAFQPTDLDDLFDEVVLSLDASIRETGGEVTRSRLPTLLADRTQLGQVLQNLIENGLKYHGEEPPRVRAEACRQDGEWVVSVRDNGIGIAEKHLERIFDIFRRLHTQEEYSGTGIGLAVCRRIIHRHGGRIWAESAPGKGSTFYFTIPDRPGKAAA